MKKIIKIIAFSFFVPLFMCAKDQNIIKTDKVFLAGAATSKITPELGVTLVGGWSGVVAEEVHDELHARCLVLDDGSTRLAFVVLDLLGLHQNVTEEIKKAIFQKTKIPREHVIISTTHTHTGPDAMRGSRWNTNPDNFHSYQKFLINQCSYLVQRAIDNLEPAHIGWGIAEVPQHVFCRRWIMKPEANAKSPFGNSEKVVMNPKYNDPNLLKPSFETDPDVTFIYAKSPNGKPIALLANYSLHYVGGVTKGHVSADYFGVFAERIKDLLNADVKNPAFIAIMSNGTEGNINNNDYSKPYVRHENYEKMNIVANDVAIEVYKATQSISYHKWVPLKAAHTEIPIQIRKPNDKMLNWANNVKDKPDNIPAEHPYEKNYANRVLDRHNYWPDKIDVILQTYRIGDLGIVTIPFEPFTNTGLSIKAKSNFKPTFVIGLANGYWGYLPTPEEHELGGYETWLGSNNVQKDATVIIEAKLLEMLKGLK